MLITLYKIGRVHFRLLGTNGFRVKAKKERFTAASSRCRQNLKYENFPSSFGRLRQNIAPKSVPHVQHDYFSSFNQSNHWFVALSLTLPSSDLKLPNFGEQTGTGVFPLVIAVSLPSLYIITILIHHGQNTFHDQNTPNSKYLLCGISHGKMYIRPMVIYNYRPK